MQIFLVGRKSRSLLSFWSFSAFSSLFLIILRLTTLHQNRSLLNRRVIWEAAGQEESLRRQRRPSYPLGAERPGKSAPAGADIWPHTAAAVQTLLFTASWEETDTVIHHVNLMTKVRKKTASKCRHHCWGTHGCGTAVLASRGRSGRCSGRRTRLRSDISGDSWLRDKNSCRCNFHPSFYIWSSLSQSSCAVFVVLDFYSWLNHNRKSGGWSPWENE